MDTDAATPHTHATPTPPDATAVFRTIDALAERCGNYCWLEHRLFELTGRAASTPTRPAGGAVDGEIRVFLSEMAARHAFLAAQWRDRLPVRAGVDADALVAPPSAQVGAAVELLAGASEARLVLSGLVEHLLPRLLLAYEEEAARASWVCEAPVRAVLDVADLLLGQELLAGRDLLWRVLDAGTPPRNVAEFGAVVQRALGDAIRIFPAARVS
jgi:hypothetical protein